MLGAKRNGFMSLRRSAEHGFTLIELMVALAIFSLAAVTLLRLQGVSTRTASEISTKTVAQIVAQNIAVDALTDPTPPAFGTSSGVAENAGQQWRWIRTSKRTDDVRLARIDIVVTTADGRPGAALSLARAVK